MAFEQQFFAPIGPNSTESPAAWAYRSSTDSFADIAAADYFDPKRFQLRPGDNIYIAAADREGIIDYAGPGLPSEILVPRDSELVLFASDDTIQEPSTTDTPQNITYGPAQGTVSDPVMVDANGVLTINEPGLYDLNLTINVGRQGSSGGTSLIFFRGLLNAVPVGRPGTTLVDNPSIVASLQFDTIVRLAAGDTFIAEIYRDSAGVNEGGLFPQVSNIGWATSPSARLRVLKIHK